MPVIGPSFPSDADCLMLGFSGGGSEIHHHAHRWMATMVLTQLSPLRHASQNPSSRLLCDTDSRTKPPEGGGSCVPLPSAPSPHIVPTEPSNRTEAFSGASHGLQDAPRAHRAAKRAARNRLPSALSGRNSKIASILPFPLTNFTFG